MALTKYCAQWHTQMVRNTFEDSVIATLHLTTFHKILSVQTLHKSKLQGNTQHNTAMVQVVFHNEQLVAIVQPCDVTMQKPFRDAAGFQGFQGWVQTQSQQTRVEQLH